jgi:outer membrane lipoprotein-sorting protein
MKRYVLPITVWLCLIAALPFNRSLAEEPLHLRSVQADFVQEKHLKILVRPLVSTGTFTFQAPQSLRWEYRTPVPSILLMHGGRVKKFVERDGRLMEDQGMPFDSMQVVLGQLSNWLDGRFADNDLFRVSFADDHTVLLVPRQQALAGLIDRIELQLVDRKGLLNGVTIYEGPDSYTRMTFDNTVLNRQIPAAVFTDK